MKNQRKSPRLGAFKSIATWSVKRFFRENIPFRAASLTFTSLLTFVPMLSVVLTGLSSLGLSEDALNALQKYIFENFIPAQGDKLFYYVSLFLKQAEKLPLIQFGFLVVMVVVLLILIERTFNAIFQVPNRRSNILSLIIFWCVILISPLMLVASVAVSSYLFSLTVWLKTSMFSEYKPFVLELIPFSLSFVGFTLFYHFIPNCWVRWRHAMLGGFLAALLFESSKKIFSYYMSHFPTYALLYGALATIPLFLLWIYLCWLIVLLSGIVTSTANWVALSGGVTRIDGLTASVIWLNRLHRAGKPLSLRALCQNMPGRCDVKPQSLLAMLLRYKFIRRSRLTKVVLAKDIEHVSLLDLYNTLPFPLPKASHYQQSHDDELLYMAHLLAMVCPRKDMSSSILMSSLSEARR